MDGCCAAGSVATVRSTARSFVVPDVCEENELVRIERDSLQCGGPVGAAVWLVTGRRPRDVHREMVVRAAAALRAQWPRADLWLVAAAENRVRAPSIVKHLGLWRDLRESRARDGLRLPIVGDSIERAETVPGGVRHRGASRVDAADLSALTDLLCEGSGNFLFAVPEPDVGVAAALVESGWDAPDAGPSRAVLRCVLARGGAVLWSFGAFDDRESGCAVFAAPDVAASLVGARGAEAS